MAATPESKVKKRVKDILKGFGADLYFAMPIGTGYGNSGVPDFLVCIKSRFVGIETKAGKGKTTALQELHLENIRSAGGTTLVINEENVDRLADMLRGLMDINELLRVEG